MAQSTIVSEVLLLACFVVLVKIPEIATTTDERITETSATTTARPLYAKDGFLAGEDTPVWSAQFAAPDIWNGYEKPKIIYTKHESPVVRDAVNYWNLLKQNGSFPVRILRSVDDNESFSSTEVFDAPWDAREDSFHSPRPVEKRSTADNEVVYPSVLVVMHYRSTLSKTHIRESKSWSNKERVLYTLAFWNTVDSSLRNIRNPRVSLRIAGIIVVISTDPSWYLGWSYGAQTYSGALCPMMDYWRSLGKTDPNFPIGSYDIVAHMTNIAPRFDNNQCSNVAPQNNPVFAVGTQGPPCNLPDKIAGLIVYDDFQFDGLHRAIGQMSKVLGGNEESPRNYGWPRRSWNSETLDPISKALKHASCMSAPKEHFPPGRPVAPILAGELYQLDKQCELLDWQNADSCGKSKLEDIPMTCNYLYCMKQEDSGDACEHIGLTLDGTVCNAEKTQICLDGACVDKPHP